jgi:hypothetical protein
MSLEETLLDSQEKGQPSLAEMLGMEKSDETDIESLKIKAEIVDGESASDAAVLLGKRYEEGDGVLQDMMEAMFWYEKSENAAGYRAIGNYYKSQGELKQAEEWYSKAAEAKYALDDDRTVPEVRNEEVKEEAKEETKEEVKEDTAPCTPEVFTEMELWKDEQIFRDIPNRGQSAMDNPPKNSFWEKYDRTLADVVSNLVNSSDKLVFYLKVYESNNARQEDEKKAFQKELDKAAKPLPKRLFQWICDEMREVPYSIGAFPPSDELRINAATKDDSIQVSYRHSLLEEPLQESDEEKYFPEMASLRKSWDNMRLSQVKPFASEFIWMLVFAVVFCGMYYWRSLGFSVWFVDHWRAIGVSDDTLVVGNWLIPLFFGTLLPVISILAADGTKSAGACFWIFVVTGLIQFFLMGLTTISEIAVCGWILVAYYAILLLLYFLVWLDVAKPYFKFLIHKKEYTKEFLDSMDTNGPLIYRVIRLLTLWNKYKNRSEATPAVIAQQERDFMTMYWQAKNLR